MPKITLPDPRVVQILKGPPGKPGASVLGSFLGPEDLGEAFWCIFWTGRPQRFRRGLVPDPPQPQVKTLEL